MNAAKERFRRVEDLFRAASKLPADHREAFLAKCSDETSVCEQVKAMLSADASVAGVLDAPAFGEGVSPSNITSSGDSRPAAPLPDRIGRYRIIGVLGEGGMGIVYEAEQDNPRRRVALKVLRRQSRSSHLLRRFQQEGQILGRLQHSGIAQILEAGTTDDGEGAQPFIVMEYINGRPLLEHVREQNVSRRERLELMALICDAVHYAHQNGVVHRDLKPGNILVVDETSQGTNATMTDRSVSHPKILDFGVARLTDADVQVLTLHTTVGELIGTVPYMSPEQAAGDPAKLDWRSDVYTLGVVLYELLTERLPQEVRHMMVHEAVRAIREDDPTPAGTVDRSLRGDLETIIAKALEKDITRRYQSAADLAADIRRHLREQPITARPASAMYRVRKFAKRNKAIVAGVAIAFISMMALTTMAVRQAIVAERSRVQERHLRSLADDRAAEAQRQSYRASLVAASAAVRYHATADAARHLDAAPEHLRGWEWAHLSSRLDDSMSSLSVPLTPRHIAVSPDGSLMASCSFGGSIILWRARDAPVALPAVVEEAPFVEYRIEGSFAQRRIRRLHFSQDAAGNILLRADANIGSVTLALGRDDSGGSLTLVSRDDHSTIDRSHNGRIGVFTAGRGDAAVILVNEIKSGRELVRIEDVSLSSLTTAFSPDDTMLALALRTHPSGHVAGLFVYEIAPSGAAMLRFSRPDLTSVTSIAFSTGGRLVGVAGAAGFLLLDTLTGDTVGESSPAPAIHALAFHPDDALLATGSGDGSVALWSASDASLISVMHGNNASVAGLAFAPPASGGRGTFVTATVDGMIRWWDAAAMSDPFVLHAPGTPYDLAFSPDGTRLAAGCLGGTDPLRIWDVATMREVLAGLDGYLSALAFDREGKRLAVGRAHGPMALIDASDGALLATLAGQWWRTDWLKFSADGAQVLSLGNSGQFVVSNVSTGERSTVARVIANLEGHGCRAAVSPDGSLVALASRNQIHLFDAGAMERIDGLNGHTGDVNALDFSPDGTRLVSASGDGTLRVWCMDRRVEIATMTGHSDVIFAARFSPDGSRIVSGGRDRVIRVWDGERYEEITQLHGHTSLVYSLAFSPDGQILASGGGDVTVRLWDTRPFRSLRVDEQGRTVPWTVNREAGAGRGPR